MGAVNTNSISLAYTEEASIGAPATNAVAEFLEPNGVSDYGANISTTARNPISKDRQNKKGTITDLSSTVSFDQDTTVSSFLAFIEGAMYSTWAKRPAWFKGEVTATAAVTTPDPHYKGSFANAAAADVAVATPVAGDWWNNTTDGFEWEYDGTSSPAPGYQGEFADDTAASAAVTSPVAGDWFNNTTTNTEWNWDTGTSAWVDSSDATGTRPTTVVNNWKASTRTNGTTPTSTTSGDTGFTLATALPGPLVAGTILFCRGFVNGTNNGLKIVDTGSTTTLIKVTDGSTLVQEDAGDGVSVYVAGYQGTAGAIAVDAQGNLTNGDVAWEDLGLEIGQGIFIGGLGASASFDNPNNSGLARVRGMAEGLLTIDKRNQVFAADAGTGKTIQIFIGWFLRNVPVDDSRFAERTYAFELAYPGLGDTDNDAYEYSRGNLINTWELGLPLNDKSGLTITTFGQDVDAITETRSAWDFRKPLFTEAFSTPNDFLRLRMQNVDETGLTTFFKEATLTINNNAGGENVLGKLGPAFVNYGNFDVSLATSAVFTSKLLTSKIRNNCTVTCDFCIFNNDGAFYIDIPAMTLGDGARDFAVNEKVKISLSAAAFGDTALGYTISETFFPYIPSEKANVC